MWEYKQRQTETPPRNSEGTKNTRSNKLKMETKAQQTPRN